MSPPFTAVHSEADPIDNRCVLITNESRAYRETLAGAVQRQRPHVAVIMVEAAALDAAVRALAPSVVVCSQLPPTVAWAVPAWVVLYPEGQRAAVLRIAHARTPVDDLGLAGVLGLIDQAHHLVQMD